MLNYNLNFYENSIVIFNCNKIKHILSYVLKYIFPNNVILEL